MSANVFAMLPKEPLPKIAISHAQRSINLFPVYAVGTWWVYAIGFNGGVVKIGRTCSPRHRLTTHWRRAKGEVVWMHLFVGVSRPTSKRVERAAIVAAAGISERVFGSEYFAGLSRADAIACVRGAA